MSPQDDMKVEKGSERLIEHAHGKPSLEIRAAQISDSPEIAGIMAAAQAALPDRSMFLINTEALVEKRLREGLEGTVLVSDSKILGFCLFRQPAAERLVASIGLKEDPPVPEDERGACIVVGSIAVSPEWQGKGIGGKLLDDVELRARERGCVHLFTTVDPRNKASLGNFNSRGYRKYIEIPDAYPTVGPDYVFDVVPAGAVPNTSKGLPRCVLHKRIEPGDSPSSD